MSNLAKGGTAKFKKLKVKRQATLNLKKGYRGSLNFVNNIFYNLTNIIIIESLRTGLEIKQAVKVIKLHYYFFGT